MSQERLIHKIGAPVTRVLLSSRFRGSALSQALYTRLYLLGKALAERREVRFLREQVRPGMVVFDVGANVGFYTFLLSELTGPAGRVHAFEPDPLSCGILQRRSKAGRYPNIDVTWAAVGNRAGTISLFCSAINRADNRVHSSHEGGRIESIEVPLMTLDDYCARRGIDRIDAIKMDIQGAEVAALLGFRKTLLRTRPRWMLIEFSPEHLRGAGASPEAFWEILDECGFQPHHAGPSGKLLPISDRPAFTHQFENGYTDVFATRVV